MAVTRRIFAAGTAAISFIGLGRPSAWAQSMAQGVPGVDSQAATTRLVMAGDTRLYGFPLVTMDKCSPYRQAYGSGECGLCAIVAVVDTVCHNVDEETAGPLLSALAQALPAETAAELAHILYEQGTDRREIELMLAAAQGWTHARGWCAWTWEAAHPQADETAEHFWDRLSDVLKGPHTAAIVGFGEDTQSNTRYGGHWTCPEHITDHEIYLRDSDVFRRIPRAETGIRPEPRWAIEDCYILSRMS
ncbi:hypothetical protein [Methylobacterium oxalidis]|uniref:Peptidase C39-like domain-containing protein n=1 Tax=Methylobacterium oxalidis TaxID=944322 RepID=A0A512JAV6_9HYPH|nr:hypothetical protein [Methylobacterium oxalidis]GEP07104.1 hypothetical protein MOX02_51420 [Methylobacterium oxalidis]GJE33996.1 hypothetical protein LDDCCGHA_4200 [Methylobacterium oxalidis]GLS66171.1 hypothetical protein GCM10007888_45530 [Methylobacterium oxalidis]